jgi:hypothetical protein
MGRARRGRRRPGRRVRERGSTGYRATGWLPPTPACKVKTKAPNERLVTPTGNVPAAAGGSQDALGRRPLGRGGLPELPGDVPRV